MRKNIIATTLLSLSLASFGCATEGGDTGGPGGGKADDYSVPTQLTKASDEDLQYLRADGVECLHMNSNGLELHEAWIKLICLPRGGVVAPTGMLLAVQSPGENGYIYESYLIPGYINGNPDDVQFKMEGNRASLSYVVSVPTEGTDEDFIYKSEKVNLTIDFSGPEDEPKVVTKFSQN